MEDVLGRRLFSAAILLGLSTSAHAAFTEKTMRAPLPRQAIERGLLLPRGWVELELDANRKTATANWSADGEREEWNDATFQYQTERVQLSMGYGGRLEFWLALPFHQASLTNSSIEAAGNGPTKAGSIGDPRVGWRYLLFDGGGPQVSQGVFEFEYKGPTANESAGSFIGGPNNFNTFVFTTGTPDAYVGLMGKFQFGPLAVSPRAGYTRRFSSTVQYLIELENFQFLGRMKPGDLFTASLKVEAQAGPLNLFATPDFRYRGATRVGTTAPGWNPNSYLDPVGGSDGFNFDVMAGAELNVSRSLDVSFYANVPLMGQDFQFFPIEDLHPTAGLTVGGNLEVRY